MPLPPSLQEARTAVSPVPAAPNGAAGVAASGPSASESIPASPPAQLPRFFVKAVIATQDPGFWSHDGTDTGRAAGALVDSLRHGRAVAGGSTITEQLAKLSTAQGAPRSVKSRLFEALTARRIELSLSKEQILAEYSARLPFGNGFTGLDAAAAGYFGKTPADLTLAESALLAGLPDAPGKLNPYRHLEAAQARQHAILDHLAASGQITSEEARQAATEPMRLRPAP